MRVANEDVRRSCEVAGAGVVMCLGYLASVVEHWREIGAGCFLWASVKNPFSLVLDVHIGFLGMFTAVCYLYYVAVKREVGGAITGYRVALTDGVLVLIGLAVLSGFRTYGAGDAIKEKILMHLLNVFFLTGALVRQTGVREEKGLGREGLFGYLGKKGLVKAAAAYLCAVGGAGAFFVGRVGRSEDGAWGRVLAGCLDGLVVYFAYSTIIWAYIYNVQHFSKKITDLSPENVEDTPYNYAVMQNCSIARAGDKEAQIKNLEIFCGYFLEVVMNIEEEIYEIVKNQVVKNVFMEQKKIRDLPEVFLTEEERHLPAQYDYSSILMKNVLYHFYVKTVYRKSLEKARSIKNVVDKMKGLLWKLDAQKKKKVIAHLEKTKAELTKISKLDTSEMSDILSMWISSFSS